MQCYVCKGKGSFLHLNQAICKKCFLKNIEKRVKKHLGRSRFKRNDSILVIGEVERELLETSVQGMPLKVTFRRKLPQELKFKHVIIGNSMDSVCSSFLDGLFAGKLKLTQSKFFNITEPLTNDELKKYTQFKGIKLKVTLPNTFLDKLRKFPEIKYNLYKNIKELRERF